MINVYTIYVNLLLLHLLVRIKHYIITQEIHIYKQTYTCMLVVKKFLSDNNFDLNGYITFLLNYKFYH